MMSEGRSGGFISCPVEDGREGDVDGRVGKKGGKGHTYEAFDGWSGVVLRVRVDVGDDFVAVVAHCCDMLVVREEGR